MTSTAVEGKAGKRGRRERRKATGKLARVGHLASWERSGLSGSEYAGLHGLDAASLYRWRAQELKQKREREAVEGSCVAEGSGFVTIDLENQAAADLGAGARVLMRHGAMELEVSGAVSVRELVGLVKALRQEVLDA